MNDRHQRPAAVRFASVRAHLDPIRKSILNYLVVAIALAGIAGFAGPAAAQNGTGQVGNFCAGQFVNPANCTANDVLFESFIVEDVIESCTQGVLGEAEVIFDAVVVSNSPNRFGIGLFVNLDGESAITGSRCLHDYLAPFSSNPGDWVQVPINGESAFTEPFPNLNGDQCGDIPGNSRALKRLQRVRIQCNDNTGDGFVDINACASWENNQNRQCSGLNQAVPGTPSKCGCTDVATNLALPASLTIRKVTTDGNGTFDFQTTSNPQFDQTFSLPEMFSISTTGNQGEEDFGGVVEPGTYTIDEFVPQGWRLDSVSCTNGDNPTLAGGGVTLGPGEEVTCTFTNSPIVPGTVTIVKNTVGGDGTFGYTGGLGNFSLTTADNSASTIFSDVQPGTYDVTELVPAGWDLTSITCNNGSVIDLANATASISVAEDESVSCTFNNARRGSITIEKLTQPSGGTGFDFVENITSTDPLGEFSLDHGDSITFDNLVSGSYNVAELGKAGWDLTGISCSGGSGFSTDVTAGSVDIDLSPGQDANCVFTNTQRASLTIVKETAGGDDLFEFISETLPDAEFSIDTASNDTVVFQNLVPGTYDVAELGPPPGWILLNAFCSSGEALWEFVEEDNALVGIVLNPGANVTCNFSNGLLGSVTVTKITIGGEGVFDYVGTDPIGNFSIDTNDFNTVDFTNVLQPGEYTIEETPIPEGWELTKVACALDTSRSSSTSLEDASVTFSVDFGETVNCTFTNTRDGQIIVRKHTVPADPDGVHEFTFEGDIAGTITDGGELSLSPQPGQYSFAEVVPAGWDLTDISCSGETDSIVNVGETGVDVSLAAGETIVCDFTNTRLGSFTVAKETDPEGAPTGFVFSGDAAGTIGDGEQITLGDLLPGTYTSAETVPAGWTLDNIACTGADNSTVLIGGTADFAAGDTSVSVDLAAGEDVVCLFSNFLDRGTIVVEKLADPETTSQTFDFSSSFAGDFTLGAGGSETTTGLMPTGFGGAGAYSVSETVPAGWTLESATCDNGDDPGSITLGAGQTVTCTFSNAINRGTIVVEKVADPADTAQSFDFSSNFAGDFSLGAGQNLVTADLLPSSEAGSYSVSETVPDGWTLESAVCDGGNAPESIDLQPGQTVTCTFSNAINRGSITVTKVADPGDTGQVFQFTSNFAGNFGLAHGESEFTGDLLPSSEAGTYSVSETVPEDWQLTSAVCDNGDQPSAIDLQPGQDVTCTFTNVQEQGEIIVVKQADPADTQQTFSFSPSWGANFTLGAGDSQASGPLQAGTYSVSETVPEGWTLDSATCDNGDDPSSISLEAEETVTCTFVNIENRLELVEIAEVCENDAPYVDYEIDAIGFDNPALTIRWIIIEDGSNDVAEQLTGQALSGRLLWPGAEVNANGQGVNWPGWVFVPGQGWVEVPTNLRPSMLLEFEANPTISQVVNYPPSTQVCNPNPEQLPDDPFRVPTLSPVGLGALALLMLLMAGIGMRRRQRVQQ